VRSTKSENKKQGERETGTNLVKMPLDKAVIAITWAPIKD
jgi:hypothetical protein